MGNDPYNKKCLKIIIREHMLYLTGAIDRNIFFSIDEKFITYTIDPLIRFSSGEMKIIYNRISIICKEFFLTGHNFLYVMKS